MSRGHSAARWLSRAARVLAPASAPPPGLRVALYHSVGVPDGPDPYGTVMPPERFREHADTLAALARDLPPIDFAPPLSDAPALAVTFDDGYRDTLTTAAPMLVDRGIPFTVFVPPDHLRRPGRTYLDEAGLRELAALPGASVGAHGSRHVPLTGLDDDALAAELGDSRARLEDVLGSAVRRMSYPFGLVDARVRDAARAAGFTSAGTSVYGTNVPGSDPCLLRRTEAVRWDTVDDLRLKLFGHWDWFRLRQGEPR